MIPRCNMNKQAGWVYGAWARWDKFRVSEIGGGERKEKGRRNKSETDGKRKGTNVDGNVRKVYSTVTACRHWHTSVQMTPTSLQSQTCP